jgi:hypothetical protein
MSLTPTTFPISEGLLEAADQAAAKLGKSRALFFREAIAKSAGYDLTKEPPSERTKKYANAQERKDAQKARVKAKAAKIKLILQKLQQDGKIEDIKALAASVGESV